MTPSHYQFADKEVIDMMAAIWGNDAARTFLTLSAFKYQMRAGRKTEDPTADLQKARHCMEMATQYHVIGPDTDEPIPGFYMEPGTIGEIMDDLLVINPANHDTPNAPTIAPPIAPPKENGWIDWNGFLDDPKPEPYVVVDLKITKCLDGDVRHGFGYWNPRTNNWNTLLEFDKSRHSIQWKKIE